MNNTKSILVRYFILLIVSVPNLSLFYSVFTPLTIYLTYALLNIFFDSSLTGNIVSFNNFSIELIPSCIAGAAYYLLLILNLSTPGIKFKKRIRLIFLSFIVFLILNVLRIFFLSLLLFTGSNFFDLAHEVFWYLLSTIFVIGIWFAEVRLYKIKQIPFYSDIKYLRSLKK